MGDSNCLLGDVPHRLARPTDRPCLTSCPQEQCIHELFQAQVERAPEAIAVAWGDACLTFHELNRRANHLAHHLQSLGVGPQVLVGICVERSLEMAVGLLAILKAGGAYVPLDPAYPSERLAFILNDTRAPVLIAQQRFANPAWLSALKVVSLDAAWDSDEPPDANPVSGVAADHVAYVLYTSGSTGTPKGVMVSHRAVVNHNTAIAQVYELGPEDRVLQFASVGFDVAVEELYPSWSSGCAVILRDDQALSSLAAFLEYVEREKLTVLNLPASFWHEWVLHLARLRIDLPGRLRAVIVGSEPVSPDRLKLWQEMAGPRIRWWNAYGLTEAAITSLVYEHGQEPCGRTIPIGRPIANVTAYVLDQYLNPVPVGAPGELYIGGAGLALGYLNRPDLTADRFIPHPFPVSAANGQAPGGLRLYRTGDRVRYLPTGDLEFLGRSDHQVKIRGFRIELGEIEAVLRQQPHEREAIVLLREQLLESNQAAMSEGLTAYVLPKEGQTGSADEVRRFLQDRLPTHMIPSALVWLTELPLTPSGKLDRRALLALEKAKPDSQDGLAGPRTPMEQTLVEIWAQVLGIEQVGIDDNFFELGGHSLLALQALARIYDAFQVELPLPVLFESPTVAALAERVKNALGSTSVQVPPIRPAGRETLLPLSFAQQQLWLIDQLEPGNIAYNIPFPLRLSGILDIVALRASLAELGRRHEILRAAITVVNAQPIQNIAPPLAPPLLVIDLSQLPESQREAEAQRLACEESRCPFDLKRGPLLRTALVQLDRTEHLLLLTMHHIVTDGWSMTILVEELAALYQALIAHRPSPLPDLAIQYVDFAVWQREWLQGDRWAAQAAYWKQQLAGAPPRLALPTDRPRPAVQTFHGARHGFALAESSSASLYALSRREGVTPFMTLLAVFQVSLYGYTGQSDLVVGSPMANRRQRETEKLVGYLVNMLALRVRLEDGLTFRELLKRVRETTLNAYAHQDLPFERLVQVLQPERNPGYNPLFQTIFTFHNRLGLASMAPGLSLKLVEIDPGTALFDLRLEISETDHGLAGFIEYNTDLFDRPTAVEMAAHYQTLVERVLVNPDQTLSELLAPIRVRRELSFRRKAPRPEPDVALVEAKNSLAQRKARLAARRAELPAEQRTVFQERLRGKSDDS